MKTPTAIRRRSKPFGTLRCEGQVSDTSASRSPLDVRHTAQRWWCCGRVGHAVTPARRCEGVQKILADEAADEARGVGQTEPSGQGRRSEFWHRAAKLRRVLTQLWHS